MAVATVDGVQMMAIGYKFSLSRPPNMLLTTTGSSKSTGTYWANFENSSGIVQSVPPPRPACLDTYFGIGEDVGSTACDDHSNQQPPAKQAGCVPQLAL